MSVEGPSVDDVAAAIVEFTRTAGDGFVLFSDEVRELGIAAYPKEVAALAEAVHALYAPVLARLEVQRHNLAVTMAENRRQRAALTFYANYAAWPDDPDGLYCAPGERQPDGSVIWDHGRVAREAIDAALVEPKGQD